MNQLISNKSSYQLVIFNLKRNWLILPFVLLIISLSVIQGLASEKSPQHLELEQCQNCHLVQGEIDINNAYLLVNDQEELCKQCHEDSIRNSHPSGVIPTNPINLPFAVDWKSELTCSSCHFVHAEIGKMNRSDKSAKNYCLECHNDEFFEKMSDKGISLIGFGHLDASPEDDFTLIDRFSFQCLTCHSKLEGVLNIAYTNGGIMQHGGGGGSHPIGKVYKEAATYGGYKSFETVNPLIELPDGKIGCTSCHEGYSQYHGKLVIEMVGSQLCMECHDL